MKKLFSFIVLLMAVSISTFALSETSIIRHHNGEVTVYDGPSKLQTALNEAEDGDTLYLGKGSYDGFTITKKIFVRGAGNHQTQINGAIYISIDSEEDDDGGVKYTEPIMEGLDVTGDIYLEYNTTGITIKKCNFLNLTISSGKHNNLTIDRCFIRSCFNYSQDISALTIVNSKIYSFYHCNNCYTKDDVMIYNSNIYRFSHYTSYFRGSIFNSIIGTYDSSYSNSSTIYYKTFTYSSLTNTLLGNTLSYDSKVKAEKVWIYSSSVLSSSLYDCLLDEATLKEKGYIGTDGTVVGCYGGATPFTLTLSTPAVDMKKSTFEVDNAKKVLNVKINLTGVAEEEESTAE